MIEQIDIFVEFILNMFELYIVYRFMNGFFEKIIVKKEILFLVYFIKYLVWVFVEAVINYPIVNLLTNFICIFIISCCYYSHFSKKLVATLIVILCLILSETIVGVVVGLSDFDVLDKSINLNNYYSFLIKVIYWTMTLVVNRQENIRNNCVVPIRFTVSIFVIIVLSIVMETIFFQQEHEDKRLISSFLLCVTLLNIIIIYIYDTLSKSFQERLQVKIMEKEIEGYHNQLNIVQKNYEEMKVFRHDYKNRLIGMQQMVIKRELVELEKYLEDILGKLSSEKIYSDTGNTAIDSIINYLLIRANEKGIQVQTDIKLPEKLDIAEDDVVVLVGNLIDNAIEACLKLPEDRKIYFRLCYDKNSLVIVVKNTYNGQLEMKEGKLLTSKTDFSIHGIGLKSVETIIEKYSGIRKIKYDKMMFVTSIILYLNIDN